MKKKIFFIIVLLLLTVLIPKTIYAITLDECQSKSINDLTSGDRDWCLTVGFPQIINSLAPAQQKNKQDLAGLQNQLAGINQKISEITNQLKLFEKDIQKREKDLAYAQKVFEGKTVDQYKFLRTYDPMLPFILSNDVSSAFQEIIIRQKVADQDRVSINQYVTDIENLNKDKESLEKNKVNLDAVQKDVASKTTFLAGEVAKVDTYLAAISAKQQEFIQAKLDSLGISRSAYNLHGGCSSDINKSPGFSPAIGFFTFGVPNRIGLNQYGAKGRADAGQSSDQILRAYYNFDGYQTYNGITISVDGYGSYSLDDYVRRIYEVPGDWPMEALKAQAIAARSYALAYTGNGARSICTTEQCQVFQKDPKGGNWDAAVSATAGQAMMSAGQPIKAWFSAVHGGYAYTSGDIGWSGTSWTKRMVDTPSGSASSFSDLLNNAYDKSAQWFYCDWGGRSANNGTGWLNPEEVADIANVILLSRSNPSAKSHLYQVDKPNPEGTDTWDASRVKQELGGNAINSVTSISVSADFGSGVTTTVNINGQSFDAKEFKNYFNLRAPSNIQIVGPLFNIENKSF